LITSAETESEVAGTRQTEGKNLVWFGEIEKNKPNDQFLPLLTVLPLNYFMMPTYACKEVKREI
jgi:hypothetical protein